MKKLYLLLLVSIACPASAEVLRGGFGFLYPDHNSSRNPGQTARAEGLGAQILMAKFTGTHEQALVTSVALAQGSLAFSAYGSRYGMSLTDTSQSTDVFGAGVGAALLEGRLTVGLKVDRSPDVFRTIARAPGKTVVGATAAYQGRNGFAAGLGLSPNAVTLALGVEASPGVRAEWVTQVENSTWETGGFAGWQGERFFVSGGLAYLDGPSAPQGLLRAGVVLGNFDLSFFVTQIIKDNENPFHGGALRVTL